MKGHSWCQAVEPGVWDPQEKGAGMQSDTNQSKCPTGLGSHLQCYSFFSPPFPSLSHPHPLLREWRGLCRPAANHVLMHSYLVVS